MNNLCEHECKVVQPEFPTTPVEPTKPPFIKNMPVRFDSVPAIPVQTTIQSDLEDVSDEGGRVGSLRGEIDAIDAEIASETAAIFSAITDGTGFVNPVAQDAVLAQDAITSFKNTNSSASLFALAQAQYAANPVGPAPDQNLIDDLLDDLDSLFSAIGDFTAHTNALSGLSFGSEINLASILRTTIASRKLSGFAGCSLLGGVFGAIAKAQEFISDMQDIARQLQRFLADVMNSIANVRSFINNFASKMLNEISNSLLKFGQAQIGLLIDSLSNGIADLFDDECFGDIFGSIATDKVRESTGKIKSAKTRKISALTSRIPKL